MAAHPVRRPLSMSLVVVTLLSAGLSSPARAQDWTQWLGGVDRNGVAGSTLGIAPDAEGIEPETVWKKSLGPGYSSPIISGKRLVLLYSDGKHDIAACVDATSGEPVWKFELGPYYKGHDGSIDGPLATPATDGEVVIALSGHGRLHALRLEDGTSLWSHDLEKGFGARKPYFGFAASPLLDGDRVYVVGGGADGKCMLALDRKTGKEVWSSGSDKIEYSSPALATLDGVPQFVMIGDDRVFSVAAADGSLLWSIDAKPDGWATALPLPGDRVFLPLEKQLMMVRCRKTEEGWDPEVVWTATGYNGYSYSFGYRDGHLYGVSKRRTVCLDAESGDLAWSERSKESSAVVAGEHLVSLSRKAGLLRVIQATPEEFREQLRHVAFPEGSHWTAPVAAGGLLYLRSGADLMACRLVEGL